MHIPLVKICGITSPEEIACLSTVGIDFYGLLVDISSPWAVSVERARELARLQTEKLCATLVTAQQQPEAWDRLIQQTKVRAIQVGIRSSPTRIRQLREKYPHDELVVMQEISYREGRFWKEDQLEEFIAAGVDFILVDLLEKVIRHDGSRPQTIPKADLIAFSRRHPNQRILLAGGISPQNVRELTAASGAVGIDVCSAVRRHGVIQPDLVAQLCTQLRNGC